MGALYSVFAQKLGEDAATYYVIADDYKEAVDMFYKRNENFKVLSMQELAFEANDNFFIAHDYDNREV